MRSGAWPVSERGSWAAIQVRLTVLRGPDFGTTIRKMSLLEVLFALLLVCLVAGIGGVAFRTWTLVRRADGQAHDVAELKVRLEAGGQTQGAQAAELRERLSPTQAGGQGLPPCLPPSAP